MNMMQMMSQFNQFKSTFQGDPKQKVMELMQQGKINQSQLNQLQAMASQFQQFINNMGMHT